MSKDRIFANARLVLPGEVVTGSLCLRGEEITAIDTGSHVPQGAMDCEGAYLAPGLIELHTDNLERHLSPRPGVDWPHRAAILAHDRELASTGITTVYDALRVGSIVSNGHDTYAKYARQLATEILALRAEGGLKISHHIHLRAEICSETLLEELAEFGAEDRVGLVSLMDHTPGQRQFRDISKLEDYLRGKYGLSDGEFEAHVAYRTGLQKQLGARHEAGAVAAAARYGATLASHDDTTVEQVETSAGHGITLGEFPTTVEAARAGHAHGVANIMGAPNLVRGGSHSGNVSAAELAELGLLDILSSDYVPAALLLAAVRLGLMWDDMAAGLARVTARPAEALGLEDRGRLAPGLRADLILFQEHARTPYLQQVWSAGHRVA